MSIPADIRSSAAVPFPATVTGSGQIQITKRNGIWTIGIPTDADWTVGHLVANSALVDNFGYAGVNLAVQGAPVLFELLNRNAAAWELGSMTYADGGSGSVGGFTIGLSRGSGPGIRGLLLNNDIIGYLQFTGDDGTADQPAAYIKAAISGTAAAGSMPGLLEFATTPAGAVFPISRLLIDSNGNTIFSAGGITRTDPGDHDYNQFYVDADGYNATGPGRGAFGLRSILDVSGGSGQKYGIRGLIEGVQNTATGGDFIGVSGISYQAFNNGGTNTGLGALGSSYGSELYGFLMNGATNYVVVSGGEAGAYIDAGASAAHRWGFSIVSNGLGRGATTDVALHFTGATATYYNTLIGIDAIVGGQYPVGAASTILALTDAGPLTVTGGIDFTGITFTGNAFASTNFSVDGAGTITTARKLVTKSGAMTLGNGLNSDITAPTTSYARIAGPTAGFSVGGFASPTNGQRLTVYNSVAQQMTIVNEDGSSTAANRIKTLTGGNVVLRAGTSSATFIYDITDTRWILVGSN